MAERSRLASLPKLPPRFTRPTRTLVLGSAALASVIAMVLTIYFAYRSAEGTVRVLGKTGTNVLVRLSAFIMLCIGIEILWNGYSALVH